MRRAVFRVSTMAVCLGVLLAAAGCGEGHGSSTALARRATPNGAEVDIRQYPANLVLRAGTHVRLSLLGVNPGQASLSPLSSSAPGVARPVRQVTDENDGLAATLDAVAVGRATLRTSSVPSCACDGPSRTLSITVQVVAAN